ncbi:MAG: response regulator [Ginsengibacter sp.]
MDRIVIIDDDKDLLQIVRSILLKKGFKVSIFSDCIKAINSITNYQPQLILLDVFIGTVDGFEICKKLKTNDITRHIPVLMYSGFPKVADTAIYEYGASDFISKPFKASELIIKIRSILSIQ